MVMAAYAGPDSDLTPVASDVDAFLRWWFQYCNRGVIEIGWMDPARGGLTNFAQFGLDDIQTAVATAVEQNLVPGQSVYMRAATVLPSTPGSKYTTDMDFVQAPGVWGDIDTQAQFDHAKTVQSIVRPNGCVITGRTPHTRVQNWFRCSEPIVSAELLRGLNVRLHRLYGGDPAVVNPTRLMRMPGTIAWPWKEGRTCEVTQFIRPAPDDPRPASYPLSLLTSQLPQDEPHPGHASTSSAPPVVGAFGLPVTGISTVGAHVAQIRSGREWHNTMIRLVAHWVSRGWSTTEILLTAATFTMPGYTTDQTRAEMAKAIDGARTKWGTPDTDPDMSRDTPIKRPAILSLADLDALPPPEWLIHGLIPEKAFVVPFGPPKAGKTFVVLSAGLHIAADRPWFGMPVKGGAVVYIAGEGVGGLSLRIKAMRQQYGMGPDIPFWVIPRAINFRVEAEVALLATVIRETIGAVPLRLLVVDTLARAMPGADENSAQEVGSVIAACDWLRDELGCTVAPIHHEGKDGERGARGTSALRGAWDAAFRIIQNGRQTILTVTDQKDAEAGQRLAFRMDEVQVGLGRSSLVPVLEDEQEGDESGSGTGRRDAGGHAGLVLHTLRDALAGPESAILPPMSGMPSGDVRGVDVNTLRRFVYEKMPTVTQEARQKAFVRSVQTLLGRGLVGVRDPWIWEV